MCDVTGGWDGWRRPFCCCFFPWGALTSINFGRFCVHSCFSAACEGVPSRGQILLTPDVPTGNFPTFDSCLSNYTLRVGLIRTVTTLHRMNSWRPVLQQAVFFSSVVAHRLTIYHVDTCSYWFCMEGGGSRPSPGPPGRSRERSSGGRGSRSVRGADGRSRRDEH